MPGCSEIRHADDTLRNCRVYAEPTNLSEDKRPKSDTPSRPIAQSRGERGERDLSQVKAVKRPPIRVGSAVESGEQDVRKGNAPRLPVQSPGPLPFEPARTTRVPPDPDGAVCSPSLGRVGSARAAVNRVGRLPSTRRRLAVRRRRRSRSERRSGYSGRTRTGRPPCRT